MLLPRKPLLALLLAGLVVGSCVGGDDPTGVSLAEVGIALQPALIPSASDESALPINRIQTVVARYPDGAVLRTQRFDVSPTAASWTIDVGVPVSGESVEVIVYLYLLHVDEAGVETVQFSGSTEPTSVSFGARLSDVNADVVRGPLSNLLVTGVSITSAPDTLYIGDDVPLEAAAETTGSAPEIFWTSLQPAVLLMVESVATGLSAGTAQVVASAGAFADTVTIEVLAADVESVHVSPDSADVVVGQSRAYTAVLFDASGEVTTGPVTWSTGNGSIAIVNFNGQVMGVSPGTTTVRATSGDLFDEAVVRVTGAPSGGAVNVWKEATSGSWTTASNWSLDRVPSAADTVEISQPGEYVVTLDADATIGALRITAPSTLVLDSADLTLTATGPGPELDISQFGVLALNTAAVIADGVANAGYFRSTGISRVEADSIVNHGQWEVTEGLQALPNDGVAFETDGTVSMVSGAQLVLGANGSVLYDGGLIGGTGSLILGLGTSLILHADLSVEGWLLALTGGSILTQDSENLTVGEASFLAVTAVDAIEIQTGQLIIDGLLTVGGADIRMPGGLQIGAGGLVSVSDNGVPATFTTGQVQNAGTLQFGGSASLRFGPGSSGQIVNFAGAILTTSPGTTTILDGQLENSGEIFISGPTQLRNEDVVGNAVTATHSNEVDATIEVFQGGELDVFLGGIQPSLFRNAGAITVYDGATLYVENMSAPAGEIRAEAGALFQGTGSVDLRGGPPALPPLGGFNNGAIAPGIFGPGIMTWLGTVPMGPTGSIEIEIDGPEAGTGFDQLNISSQLYLNGNGTLDMRGSTYSAFMGDRFPILSYNERVGDFADVLFPQIGNLRFDTLTVITQDPSVADTLVLVVVAGPSPVVADWQFDEGQGQAALDLLGLGMHGTLGPTGTVEAADPTRLQDGRLAGALRFAGAQFVGVGDSLPLEPQTFTIEAFVRAPASPGAFRYILSKGGGPTSATSASYAFYTGSTGGLVFYTSVNGSSAATYYSSFIDGASIWDGQWHHIAGTFNGFQVAIWVDGVQVGPANPAAVGYATPQGALTIGALYPGDTTYGFVGDIDEVRLVQRVLSATEIQERASRGGP